MARPSAFAILLVMTANLLAGCTSWDCGYEVGKEWKQDGIFEKFPPQGDRGAYSVSYGPPGSADVMEKNAVAKDLDRSLGAYKDGRVSWSMHGAGSLSEEETGAALKETFSALGLPGPVPPNWAFQWNSSSC